MLSFEKSAKKSRYWLSQPNYLNLCIDGQACLQQSIAIEAHTRITSTIHAFYPSSNSQRSKNSFRSGSWPSRRTGHAQRPKPGSTTILQLSHCIWRLLLHYLPATSSSFARNASPLIAARVPNDTINTVSIAISIAFTISHRLGLSTCLLKQLCHSDAHDRVKFLKGSAAGKFKDRTAWLRWLRI